MLTIGFIGAGNMAQAMMQGWSGNPEVQLTVYSPHSGKQVAQKLGITAKDSAMEVWLASDLVVLATPADGLEATAKELQPAILMKPSVIVASVLGGISLAQLHQALGEQLIITRTLPNVNVGVKYGYTALAFDADTDPDVKGAVAALFLEFGRTDELPEEQFGAVSAVAGSGPAFVAAFTEALKQAAMKNGITEEIAARLAEQTVAGTARHMIQAKKTPLTLANEVMTPGGSTAAGYDVLQKGDLNQLVLDTIAATMAKNAEFE
ncbi:pyrroline-5-carboxylate reductase family protein [Weissella bombi]|uniref:Pyrroline-5-carboxylate reductase n=1 Tax=Weissella bombi TaxID=1505725 RepID=A0A1C4BGM8_9LACO|nr:pyrroline-5-carboxylate reductase dimerization domain-containing protein [Weissella bombi]SCC06017.1 pyrroline-5-carboxylate reductase [Weissella bombi]